MPITVDDYRREWREELLAEATPEEISQHLTPKQRLEGLTREEILEAMKALGMRVNADGHFEQKEAT